MLVPRSEAFHERNYSINFCFSSKRNLAPGLTFWLPGNQNSGKSAGGHGQVVAAIHVKALREFLAEEAE